MTKAMSEEKSEIKEPSAQEVIDFLKANPKFLQKYPQAMDYLIPPKNGTDKKVKDFMSFMVEKLPARVRWQAFNPQQADSCLSIVTWPLTIDALWERGATWPGHQAYLRVIEFTSERDAAEAYSAFSLEQGVSADECSGFAPNPTPFDHDAIDVRHREVDIGLGDDVRHNTWIGPPPVGMTDVDSVTSTIIQHGRQIVLLAIASGPGAVAPTDVGVLAEEMLRRLDG